MKASSDLKPSRVTASALHLEEATRCDPGFYRRLYAEVGRDYHWTDRLSWTDAEIAAHLADPGLSLHVLYEGEDIAGYFELKRGNDGGIELAYFGLMRHAIGRGLGKPRREQQ
jgi:hypothetical protein